ncbi:hypothetical protein [Actinomadura miaoliensis]|uniref:Uncharacterized protein n=1 Tax=Actinomadura miaoliensis TaxID=430685 RepID=A0ABP7V5F1_9ACTN
MAVLPDPAWLAQRERLERAGRRLRMRHLAWRARRRTQQDTRTAYLVYYEDNEQPWTEPEHSAADIWRDCLHRAVLLIIGHCTVAAMICLWDAWPALATLPYVLGIAE